MLLALGLWQLLYLVQQHLGKCSHTIVIVEHVETYFVWCNQQQTL